MKKLLKILFVIYGVATWSLLTPQLAFASILANNYTCNTNWSGSALTGSVTCNAGGSTLGFSTADSQTAANNGAGNTLLNIYPGSASTIHFSVTVSSMTGTLRAKCFGDTNNCTAVNLSNGANSEVAMTMPAQSSFAYIVFDNNSGGASGNVTGICVDNDGTSCAAAGATTRPDPQTGWFAVMTQL